MATVSNKDNKTEKKDTFKETHNTVLQSSEKRTREDIKGQKEA